MMKYMAKINRKYFNTFQAVTKGLSEKSLFSLTFAQNTGNKKRLT